MARAERESIGPFETVGAWLHLWTPPREVEVPPVPKRKLAIGALIAAVVLGAAAAVAVPAIDSGKKEGAAQRRAKAAALKLLYGEMAAVVTTGARVIPKRLHELGYEFRQPELEAALRSVV